MKLILLLAFIVAAASTVQEDNCQDLSSKCPDLKHRCDKKWTAKNCKQTCGLCPASCPETCKCQTGGVADGGLEVNSAGYCTSYCSKWGYCGDGELYRRGAYVDCTGCACPETCKCQTGGAHDGGLKVNSAGYCNSYCSKWGYCGDGELYKTGAFVDCTGCSSG